MPACWSTASRHRLTETQQKRRVRSLQRGDHAPRKIARLIRNCRRRRRCRNPACPVCIRRFRIWLTAEIIKLFKVIADPVLVTAISPGSSFGIGNLDAARARRFLDRLRQHLWRCGYRAPAIGAIDVCTRATATNTRSICISLHGKDRACFRRLRKWYPRTELNSPGFRSSGSPICRGR